MINISPAMKFSGTQLVALSQLYVHVLTKPIIEAKNKNTCHNCHNTQIARKYVPHYITF